MIKLRSNDSQIGRLSGLTTEEYVTTVEVFNEHDLKMYEINLVFVSEFSVNEKVLKVINFILEDQDAFLLQICLDEGLVGGTFCLRKLKAEFSVPNITIPFTDFTYPLCPRKLEAGYSSHYCWINTQYPVDCPLVSAKLSSQKPCVTGILIVSGLHQALLDQAIKDHGSVYISYMVGKSRNQLILPAAKTPR